MGHKVLVHAYNLPCTLHMETANRTVYSFQKWLSSFHVSLKVSFIKYKTIICCIGRVSPPELKLTLEGFTEKLHLF